MVVVFFLDGGFTFSELTFVMYCSGATFCELVLNLVVDGSVVVVNVEQIGYQLNVETSYLFGVGG